MLVLLWLLAFLLLVADATCLGLNLADLPEIQTDRTGAERVGLRLAPVLLVGRTKAADEGVKAAPGLTERAGTWRRRVGVAEEGAHVGVNFGLPELIQVAEELEHIGAAALREGERWAVVFQVLAEGVPVSAFLVFVSAWCGS